MKKLFLLAITAMPLSIWAQVILEGRVLNESDKKPIENVEIFPVDEKIESVFTDANGKFTIEVKKESGTLQAVTPMFTTAYAVYKGPQHLEILINDAVSLQEVVAVGFGTQKRGDISTAVGIVNNTENINDRAVTNVSEFLQGQVPGVTITQNGGDPTTMPSINIRGNSTITSESVLYVVDGMPYYGSPINPNDIKSISVLKDAAAAGIYGAQASGGVILIETKKGVKGKPLLDLNIFTGFRQATNLPTPLTSEQRNSVYNQAALNDGEAPLEAYDATKNPWGAVTRTNWIDEIFRPGFFNGVNLSLSGASDNINYYTSLEYMNKEGVLIGTNFSRYALRSKVGYNIFDNLSAGINISYLRNEAIGTNTSSGYSGTILNALYMPSSAPVYDENGNFHGTVPFRLQGLAGAYGDVYNPVGLLLRPTISNPVNNITAQGNIDYEPVKHLSLSTRFSYNLENIEYKKFTPRVPEIGRSNEENFLDQSYTKNANWTWDNQLTYNNKIGLHSLDFTLINSAQQWESEYTYLQGKNFDGESENYQYLEFAGEISEREGRKEKYRLASVISRLMYDYDKKYYLTASIRRDETSKTNPEDNYQVGWFPTASFAWRVSNESFFNSQIFSDLKLRGSWGQIGNVYPLSAYAYDNVLSGGKVVLQSDGNTNLRGIWANRLASRTVSWEKVESYDIGLDIELWNKLNIGVDYYNKTTKDMILEGAKDAHWGVSAPFVNGGRVENKGIELSINFKDKIGEVSYNVGGNLASNSNELVNLEGYGLSGSDFYFDGTKVRDQLKPFGTPIGNPLNSYYLIKTAGIFKTQQEVDSYVGPNGDLIQPNAKPGDLKFVDINNDGKINDADRVVAGDYNPDLTYAFMFNVNYKNFDLSMMFQGVYGVEVFNAYKYSAYNLSNNFNVDNRILNAWTENNTGSDIPKYTRLDQNKNFSTSSDWYVEDGSYLRLRTVTLGYNFAPFMNTMFKTARIYMTGENLFTITKYTGLDPEVGGKGLDNGKYPISRVFTMGINLQF